MSKIKNGGLDQYGKVQSISGIGSEKVKNWGRLHKKWGISEDILQYIQ